MNRSLLTYDQVAEWRHRLEQIAREEQVLAKEKSLLKRKLEALEILFAEIDIEDPTKDISPQEVVQQPKRHTKSSRSRPTWPEEIMRIFKVQRRPLTTNDLRELIEEGPLRGEYEKSDKGFYHAMSRLQKRDDLRKHRGWLFMTEDYEEHIRKVAAGEIDDVEEVSAFANRHSPMGEAIKNFLDGHPEGVTSKEIIAYLKKDSRFVDTLTKNTTGAYNVISRLTKRGEIQKDGMMIYPIKENEPPEGGSEAEEGVASSDFSSNTAQKGDRRS